MTAAALARARDLTWPLSLISLALAITGILLLFARDAADMARIWWTSSTYEHCLLIAPIAGWLVWLRRDDLAALPVFGWAPGLALVMAGACIWLVGDAGSVAIARHLGLVAMVQGAIVACLGPAIARGVAFPLAFLLFLIPFGEAFEPPLQLMTAQICDVLLAFAHVPARIDGVFITTPAGVFQVAEACSGVKFLVAMLAFGALAAHVGFRSWPRRIALMAAAITLPVLANGVRAWGTIMVAGRMGAGFANDFDHVFYGWIFFGLVIALMLACAWRFFDRSVDAPWIDRAAIEASTMSLRKQSPLMMGVMTVMLAAAAPAWSARVASAGVARLPVTSLPDVPGWTRIDVRSSWTPRFDGADRMLRATYRDGAGHAVDLVAALFADQGRGRSLVGFGQGAAPPDGGWAWVADEVSPPGSRALRLRGGDGSFRDVVVAYRLGGIVTGSDNAVKLATLRLHLLGGDRAAAAVLVSAGEAGGGRPAIDRFMAASGPLAPLADRLTGR